MHLPRFRAIFLSTLLVSASHVAFAFNASLPDEQPDSLKLESSQLNWDIPFDVSTEYSDQTGFTLGVKGAHALGESSAAALEAELGQRNYRLNGTFGHQLSANQRLKATAEYLTQNLDFDFTTGTTRQWVGQFAGGLGYQYMLPDSGLFKTVNLSSYFSSAQSKNLADVDFLKNGKSYTNQRRIAGANAYNASAGVTIMPWETANIDLDLLYDIVDYQTRLGPDNNDSDGLGASINWEQKITNSLKAAVSGSMRQPYDEYGASVSWLAFSQPGHALEISAKASYLDGDQNLRDNAKVGLQFGYKFDGDPSQPAQEYTNFVPAAQQNLVDWTSEPVVRMPQVLAIADERVIENIGALMPPFAGALKNFEVYEQTNFRKDLAYGFSDPNQPLLDNLSGSPSFKGVPSVNASPITSDAADNQLLTYHIVEAPAKGKGWNNLKLTNKSGVLSATSPAVDERTPYKASVRACLVSDSNLCSAPAEFTITVIPLESPEAHDIDAIDVNTDAAISYDVSHGFSDPNSSTLSYALVNAPSWLSIDDEDGQITGTAPKVTEPTEFPITVKATNKSNKFVENNFEITVNPVVTTSLTINKPADVTTLAGAAITPITLQATGDGPLNFTVDKLPQGLSLNDDTISGTPSTAGVTDVTVTVTDKHDATATTSFAIDVNPQVAVNADDKFGTVGVAIAPISFDVSGEAPFNCSFDRLPPGITFDPTTNTLNGTPTQVGVTNIHLIVTDKNGNTGTADFKFTVTAADLTLNKPDDQSLIVGNDITPIALSATGTGPFKYSVAGLPTGTQFDSSTHRITGTPITVGNYPVTATVTDEHGNSDTASFNIDVTQSAAIAQPANQNIIIGQSISAITLHGHGHGNLTYSVTGLPAGAAFDSSAKRITGTPTNVGSYPVTATVTDQNNNTDSTSFTITVDPTATISPVNNQTVTVGQTISVITLTGSGAGNLTYNVTGLPAGTAFDSSAKRITGTPTAVGSYPVTATVTDQNNNTDSTSFTITVDPTATINPVTDQSLAVGQSIAPISLSGSGAGTLSYSVSGLPAGTAFDSAAHRITGTPTAVGNYSVTATVRDQNNNTASTSFNISVTPPTLSINQPADQSIMLTQGITPVSLSANGSGPLNFTVTGLPSGTQFDSANNRITGTPTASGSFPVAVTVTDQHGNSASTNFTVSVAAGISINNPGNKVVSINSSLPSFKLTATGTGRLYYNATGLPRGVTLINSTGQITGTPYQPGKSTVTAIVTDSTGATASTTFTIDVVGPPTMNFPRQKIYMYYPMSFDLGRYIVGADNVTITGLENLRGLRYTPYTGMITGRPYGSSPGYYVFKVTASNAHGTTTKQLIFQLCINSGGFGSRCYNNTVYSAP